MALAATVTRALARSVIPKYFEQGFSASAALRHFSSISPGRRKTDWLKDWREITGAKKLERVYRFIPRKHRLSYGLMAPTETFQQHEFKYVFTATGHDATTGKEAKRTMSLGSDIRYDPDKVEEDYMNILDAESGHYLEAYGFVPESVELMVVYRRKHAESISPFGHQRGW